MIHVDGSQGEGGGQVLRTSLALALATGQPVRIDDVRAGRERPGLLRQHLTALAAAAAVGRAEVEGADLGSRTVTFRPRGLQGGRHRFRVGSAGSTALVLQAVLPALLTAGEPSELTIEGGTHAAWAPPFEFLAETLLPLLGRMGPRVEARLERHGFHPAGGGRLVVRIEPAAALAPLELLERGPLGRRRAVALTAHVPEHVAGRELAVVARRLSWPDEWLERREVESDGPGNALLLVVEAGPVTEVFSAFGSHGVRAEAVAEAAVREARTWLASGAPVGEHLADQLMVPLALAGGGAFRCVRRTRHAMTNGDVLGSFVGVPTRWERHGDGSWTWRVA